MLQNTPIKEEQDRKLNWFLKGIMFVMLRPDNFGNPDSNLPSSAQNGPVHVLHHHLITRIPHCNINF